MKQRTSTLNSCLSLLGGFMIAAGVIAFFIIFGVLNDYLHPSQYNHSSLLGLILNFVVMVLGLGLGALLVARNTLNPHTSHFSGDRFSHEGYLFIHQQAVAPCKLIFDSRARSLSFVYQDHNNNVLDVLFEDIKSIKIPWGHWANNVTINTNNSEYVFSFDKDPDAYKQRTKLFWWTMFLGNIIWIFARPKFSFAQTNPTEWLHYWLRFHHVKAYRQILSQIQKSLLLMVGILPAVWIVMGIVFTIKEL